MTRTAEPRAPAKSGDAARGGRRPVPLARLVWILPLAFALHEAEEWNIVAWFHAHFTPRTEATAAGARSLLVAFGLGGFFYTWLATLLPSPRATLAAVLAFFVVVGVGNALVHVFWALSFGAYAPGVLTAALLVTPATVYVSLRAVREGAVPGWLVAGLYALAIVPVVTVARAGRTLTPEQLALHRLAAALGRWLWGAG